MGSVLGALVKALPALVGIIPKVPSVVVKILGVPAVAELIKTITGKLLKNRGIDPKVTAFGLPAAIAELIIFAAGAYDPALGELLQANRATILEFAVLLGAIFAYFTPNGVPTPEEA